MSLITQNGKQNATNYLGAPIFSNIYLGDPINMCYKLGSQINKGRPTDHGFGDPLRTRPNHGRSVMSAPTWLAIRNTGILEFIMYVTLSFIQIMMPTYASFIYSLHFGRLMNHG